MKCSPRSKWCPVGLLAAVAVALLVQDTWSAQGKAEDEVKDAFIALQGAIKAKDPAKIWALLDSDTQSDADKAAKKVKSAYKKANDKQKADQEKNLGLTPDELAKLDGQLLLKTKRFLGKYDEVVDSKITSIAVKGDTAVLNYVEADGDKEKFNYTRQGGKWKVAMPLPEFAK
jgi:hypothetical protein